MRICWACPEKRFFRFSGRAAPGSVFASFRPSRTLLHTQVKELASQTLGLRTSFTVVKNYLTRCLRDVYIRAARNALRAPSASLTHGLFTKTKCNRWACWFCFARQPVVLLSFPNCQQSKHWATLAVPNSMLACSYRAFTISETSAPLYSIHFFLYNEISQMQFQIKL